MSRRRPFDRQLRRDADLLDLPAEAKGCSSSLSKTANLMLDDPAFTTAMHSSWPCPSHSRDDVCAAVDVDRAAGDPPGVVAREIGTGGADIVDVDQFMQRRALDGVVEQALEVLDARRRARLERAGRNGVDADVLRPKLDRRDSGRPPRARP